jgi:catalytic LigB subunit of aromatic ring-opening dioxygenase
MFVAAEHWPTVHRGLAGAVPQPPELAQETPEVLQDQARRVEHGFAALRAQLETAKPDAVFIIGDDQNELFSNALIPSFAIFIGDAAEGTYSISWIGEKPKDNWIKLPCNSAVAKIALDGLVARGFDFGYVEKIVPLARPELGIGHAFTRIGRVMHLVESGIPAIPIFTNAYHPPLPSAARCYALGQALREIFADRPERVAIYGSGGLSHDPRGPRAGWVDEPLDRWVLDKIAAGEGAALKSLFTPAVASFGAGTGEIRNWVAVAGAYEGVKATVVDYIPARHAVTGLGFAYWHAPG